MNALLFAVLLAAVPPPPVMPGQDAPVLSADRELRAAASWLSARLADGVIALADVPYIKFFTTYTVPREIPVNLEGTGIPGVEAPTNLRTASPFVLSFVLNSLAAYDADGKSVQPFPVTPTVYKIDIRDYGWDVARWEAAVATDPYFLSPLAESVAIGNVNYPAGTIMVRADWFIVHATDARKQIDRGLKQDDVIYYTLIYGRGKQPKTLVEFQTVWGVDPKLANLKRADFGVVIEKGKSGVSRGARRLIGLRTIFGEYWETRDDRNEDYVEQSLSDVFEAGEAITNNVRGLQVYTLFNKDKKIVEDGDVGLVVDHTDSHDPRVRTGSSCMTCHPLGINVPGTNVLVELNKAGVPIHSEKYKDVLKRLERFYLDGKFDVAVVQANARYAGAVAAVNGLSPTQNATAFKALFDWYAYQDLTLEQAAAETGLTQEAYLKAIVATASGRLSGMFKASRPIPRQFWEASVVGGKVLGGAYAESILHIKGRTAEAARLVAGVHTVVVTAVLAQIKAGKVTVLELPAGTRLEYVGVTGDWISVRHKDGAGHIHKSQCRLE